MPSVEVMLDELIQLYGTIEIDKWSNAESVDRYMVHGPSGDEIGRGIDLKTAVFNAWTRRAHG